MRPSKRALSASSQFLLVSPPYFQFQPPDGDVVYTQGEPRLVQSSTSLTSRPVGSQQRFQFVCETFEKGLRRIVAFPMDLKGGIKPDNKKRGPVTALLSRQNSKTGRGSTPASSDQDSPPIVPDTIDSPLLGKKTANNGAGSVSRTASIRSRQGENQLTVDRNADSPLPPKSRDHTPFREGSEPISDDSLGSKGTTGSKRMVDSAKKKILWLSSKSEWGSLEQALKALEQTIAAQKNSPDALPLAGIQDEVISFRKSQKLFQHFLLFRLKKDNWLHAIDVRRQGQPAPYN